MTAPFQLGLISTGTLKTEDLLPKLMETMERLGVRYPGDLECGTRIEYTNLPSLNSIAVIDENDSFWQSEESQWDIEALIDALQDVCPPFVYLGARQCTSCITDEPCVEASKDFGFWPDWDALNEAMKDPEHTLINGILWRIPRDEAVLVRFHGSDYATVTDLDHNILWSTAQQINPQE